MPRAARALKSQKTPVCKSAKRGKIAQKKPANPLTAQRLAVAKNRAAHWKAYRELQKKTDKAWNKLQSDVKKKARPEVLLQDRNTLALLLGECNYMTRECMSLMDYEASRHRKTL